jgi:Dockerin type I domain/Putative binding domain, N-terminal
MQMIRMESSTVSVLSIVACALVVHGCASGPSNTVGPTSPASKNYRGTLATENYAQSTIDVTLMAAPGGGQSVTGTYATSNGITGQVDGTIAGTLESGTFSGTLSYLTSPLGGRNCNGAGAFTGTVDASAGIKWTSPGFRSSCSGDPKTVELKAPPGGSGPAPITCAYTLSVGPSIDGYPNGLTIPVALTTGAGCAWTSSADVSWLHLPPGASGSGSATVTLNIDANSGPARTGTFTIGFQTVTVNQSSATCAYTVSPLSLTSPLDGGSLSVTVTAAAGCAWSSSSNAPFIHVTSGNTGTGSGTVVLAVDAATSARVGTLNVAGQTVTVSQSAPSACSYTLSIGSQISGYPNGGSFPVTVTTAPGCVWTAAANDSWIHVPATSTAGSGLVTFTVDANLGASRTGTLTIAGQTITFNQTSACSYTVSPTSLNASPNGGSLSATVAADGGCAWTAASNAPFIHVTAGAAGTGNGTVTFTVDANNGPLRTGTLTIANQTVTVTQGPPCTYAVSTSVIGAGRDGGSFAFNVTAASLCAWTAASEASHIGISSGSAGNGNGTVAFFVDPNPGDPRTGSIVVNWPGGGARVTVNQNGAPAPPTFSRCDFNQDNVIDNTDLNIMRQAIASGSQDPKYDLNRDGKVDATDLQIETNATRNPSSCPP